VQRAAAHPINHITLNQEFEGGKDSTKPPGVCSQPKHRLRQPISNVVGRRNQSKKKNSVPPFQTENAHATIEDRLARWPDQFFKKAGPNAGLAAGDGGASIKHQQDPFKENTKFDKIDPLGRGPGWAKNVKPWVSHRGRQQKRDPSAARCGSKNIKQPSTGHQ